MIISRETNLSLWKVPWGWPRVQLAPDKPPLGPGVRPRRRFYKGKRAKGKLYKKPLPFEVSTDTKECQSSERLWPVLKINKGHIYIDFFFKLHPMNYCMKCDSK